jgi:hypothetical protein
MILILIVNEVARTQPKYIFIYLIKTSFINNLLSQLFCKQIYTVCEREGDDTGIDCNL